MDNCTAELTLRTENFKRIRCFLVRIEGANVGRLQDLFEAGTMSTYGIYLGEKLIGALCLTVEIDGPEKWLIVNALYAEPVDGIDVTGDTFDKMTALARATECAGIRIWTEREGLRHKLEKRGAKTRYVMELVTNGI